jgi:hypothetical protein
MITVEKRTTSLLFKVEFSAGGKNLESSRSGLPQHAQQLTVSKTGWGVKFLTPFLEITISLWLIIPQRPLSLRHFAEYW